MKRLANKLALPPFTPPSVTPFQEWNMVTRLQAVVGDEAMVTRRESQQAPGVAAVKDVFLYDPFAKQTKPKRANTEPTILVQGESAVVEIELTNPFAVDIPIQSIDLVSDGVDVVVQPVSVADLVILGRPAVSTLKVVICPHAIGKLLIKACRITFSTGWTEIWRLDSQGRGCLTGDGLSWDVVPRLPRLAIQRPSEHERNLALFEGEHGLMALRLLNDGGEDAKILNVKCFDTEADAADDVRDGEDVFESTWYRLQNRALDWDQPTLAIIPTGGHLEVDLTVFGKRGCTGSRLEIEYGLERDGVTWSRRLAFQLQMTVHRALVPVHLDILPYWPPTNNDLVKTTSAEELVVDEGQSISADRYCLVALDLRNVWSSPFTVRFKLGSFHDINEDKKNSNVITESPPTVIYPWQTKRLAVPISRISLQSLFDQILNTPDCVSEVIEKGFAVSLVPNDPVSDVPPIPVLENRQYVVPQHGQHKHTAAVRQALDKSRRLQRERLTQDKYHGNFAEMGQLWCRQKPVVEDWKQMDRELGKLNWWHALDPAAAEDSGNDSEGDEDPLNLVMLCEDATGHKASSVGDAKRRLRSWHATVVDEERWTRLVFWYRHILFDRLIVSTEWSNIGRTKYFTDAPTVLVGGSGCAAQGSSERRGVLDLRSLMRLNRQSLNHLRSDAVRVGVELVGAHAERLSGRNRWRVALNTDTVLHFQFSSFETEPKRYMFRLLALEDDQEPVSPQKVLISGSSHAVIQAPQQIKVPVRFLAHGTYRFCWCLDRLSDHYIQWNMDPVSVVVE